MAKRIRYEFSANPYEGMTVYPVKLLQGMPTLTEGQFDNVKLYAGGFRYRLSRCYGVMGGDDYQVTVDRQGARGHWEEMLRYREVPEVDEDPEHGALVLAGGRVVRVGE